MKLLTHTILAALCALPVLAISGEAYCSGPDQSSGCPPTGYIFAYGGVFGGYNVDGHEPRFPSNEHLTMDSGYIVGGGGGIYSDFFNGSRFEIEGLNAKNDIGRITSDIFDGNGFVNYGFRGELSTRALMVNALKEIPLCGLTGYVGGGLGFSDNEITVYNPLNVGTSESDVALAYQFIAGVDVPVTKCVDIFLQYKLLGVAETEYQRLDFVVDSHFTHNVVFGARLSF